MPAQTICKWGPDTVHIPTFGISPGAAKRLASSIDMAADLEAAGPFHDHLPSGFAPFLYGLRRPESIGIAHVRGLNIGAVPAKADATFHEVPVAARTLLGIAQLLGAPCAAGDWGATTPVTDVRVHAGHEDSVSSWGAMPLPLHTENDHLPNPPDFLVMLTVRSGAPTLVVPVTDVLARLSEAGGPGAVSALAEPRFVRSAPASFGSATATGPVPPLLGST